MKKQGLFVRKICLGLLLTVTLFSNIAFAYGDGLSEWARPVVEKSIEKGRVPIDLRPFNRAITRREFCYILSNFTLDRIGVTHEHLLKIEKVKIEDFQFEDTDDYQVSFCAALGLVKGVSPTHFNPDKSLTRQEAATIICRLYIYLNNQEPGIEHRTEAQPFQDRDKIADWALKPIDFMAKCGVMRGYRNGNFGPNDTYTIEQAIVTTSRTAFGE